MIRLKARIGWCMWERRNARAEGCSNYLGAGKSRGNGSTAWQGGCYYEGTCQRLSGLQLSAWSPRERTCLEAVVVFEMLWRLRRSRLQRLCKQFPRSQRLTLPSKRAGRLSNLSHDGLKIAAISARGQRHACLRASFCREIRTYSEREASPLLAVRARQDAVVQCTG